MLSASGSEYVEVLVTIEGSRKDARQVAVGVRRKPPLSAVREQLMSRLSAHYRSFRES
jgi:hypothetical protein